MKAATIVFGAVILATGITVVRGQVAGTPEVKTRTGTAVPEKAPAGLESSAGGKSGASTTASKPGSKPTQAELKIRLNSADLDSKLAEEGMQESGERLRQRLVQFAEKYKKLDMHKVQETNRAASELLQLCEEIDAQAQQILNDAPALRQSYKKYQKSLQESVPALKDLVEIYLGLSANPDDEYAATYARLAESAKRLAVKRDAQQQEAGTTEQSFEADLKKIEKARTFIANVKPLLNRAIVDEDFEKEFERLQEFQKTMQTLVKTIEEFAKDLSTKPVPPKTPIPTPRGTQA